MDRDEAPAATSLLYLTSLVDESFETSSFRPYCYLLEIDNTKILLDGGVSISSSGVVLGSTLQSFKTLLKDVSLVLCSHASVEFIGGLPLILPMLPASAPIYMTLATQCMARILFSDLQSSIFVKEHDEKKDENEPASLVRVSHSQLYPPHAIEHLFKRIVTLRYSQSFTIENIIISPFAAGASLGGAYWRIRKGTDDIIYAVGISTKRERHLDSCFLAANSSGRPSLFITDSDLALTVLPSRKSRDTELVEMISLHLKANPSGDILVICPAVGKTLELILLLDAYWQLSKAPAQLIITGVEACRLIDFAQSMLEWMGDSVLKAFSTTRENPFALKHAKYVRELDPKDPYDKSRRVVLLATADEHLQCSSSYGRQLFMEQFSKNPKSLVIFTNNNPPPCSSLSYDLLSNNGVLDAEKCAQLKYYRRIVLSEEEIPKLSKKEMHSTIEAEDEEEEDEDLHEEDNQNHDDENEPQPGRSVADPSLKSGFLDKTHPSSRMASFTMSNGFIFPHKEKRRPLSAYGELLDPADWPMFSFDQQKTDTSSLEIAASTLSQKHQPSLGDQLSILGVLSSDPLNSLGAKENEDVISDPYCRLVKEFPFSTSSKIECSFKWTDYFIRSDGRALKSLLTQLMPKKLILLHGGSDETIYLSQWYKLAFSDVYIDEGDDLSTASSSPSSKEIVLALVEGKRINISELTNIFHITLSESLISSLVFHSKENVEIARIKGKMATMPSTKDDDDEGTKYILEPLPVHEIEKKDDDIVALLFSKYDPVIKPADFGSIQIINGNLSLLTLRAQIASVLPYLRCILNEATSTLMVHRGSASIAEISKNPRGELNIFGDLSPDYLHLKRLVSQTTLKL